MSVTRSRGLARKIFPLNATEFGQLTFANTLTYGSKLDYLGRRRLILWQI